MLRRKPPEEVDPLKHLLHILGVYLTMREEIFMGSWEEVKPRAGEWHQAYTDLRDAYRNLPFEVRSP